MLKNKNNNKSFFQSFESLLTFFCLFKSSILVSEIVEKIKQLVEFTNKTSVKINEF